MDFDPSVPRSDRESGQCALHKDPDAKSQDPNVGIFIALFCALFQCGYTRSIRKRRQASELLRGQRVVGRILKKTTTVGEGTSYDVDYSFPAGQRWFTRPKASVSAELYGKLRRQGAGVGSS